MKRFIIHLAANAGALYLITRLLEGSFAITGGIKGYLIAALIIGVVNALVKPVLKLLSLPFVILTLGLFSIVINVVMLILSRYILNAFAIEGVSMQISNLPTYLYVALLLSLANMIVHSFK